MLFYNTVGQFGEEGFEMTAEELFLLDIGTGTYTEYDPADPELIKHMMTNRHLLTMKKGHIHSHNNMAVFFSGTDDGELVDNCGFHNFYLSLIINNKNDMCAKVAFKAKGQIETVTKLTFRDQEGKEKTRDMKSTKEQEYVYSYKCKVIKPQGDVEVSFKSRFQQIRESNLKAQEEMAKKSVGAAYKGFDVGGRWKDFWKEENEYGSSQGELFRDVKGADRTIKSEKVETYKRGGTTETPYTSTGSMGRGHMVVGETSRITHMLCKLIMMDHLYEGTLKKALKHINDKYFDGDGIKADTSYEATMYFDAIEKRTTEFYIEAFSEDQKMTIFTSVIDRAFDVLDTYDNEFPIVIEELKESLNSVVNSF